MDNSNPLGLFSDKLFYSAHFMDPAIWESYVRQACKQHGFGCKRVIPGLPGSFPTFIVELEAEVVQQQFGFMVVKFFGPLFEGAASFHVEQTMGHFLRQHPLSILSPSILANGQLTPEWWYLIFEYIPGMSIGQARHQLSADTWMGVARQMGEFMKALHSTTATILPELLMSSSDMYWDGFVDFLELQSAHCYANHQKWNDLPLHLLEQVQDFILPVEQLLDLSALPHLIHADLTSDHLLGVLAPTPGLSPIDSQSSPIGGTVWHPLAIIDWGDARVGNILYELVALHLDLFQADKHLLHSCLEVYGLSDFYCQDFPRKALSMVLLHQFPMPADIYAPHRDARTLQELAERLFGI